MSLFVAVGNGFSQGFLNLGFNSAQLSGYTSGEYVPATSAIPGWLGYIGTNPQTTVLYNDLTIGEAAIAILGTNSPSVSPIPGNCYTVVLQASLEDNASIAQTALIPGTAESIFFTASAPYSSGWQVSVAGQDISVFQTSALGGNIYVYEGNISAFAGQTDQLQFTALAGGSSPVNMELDAIQFSSSPVPEPGVMGLCALGGLLLAWRRLKTS